MPSCGEWSLVSTRSDHCVAIPMRCRRWDCPACAPRQRRRLLKALADCEVDTLVTLTCNPRYYPTPGMALMRLSLALPHLIKRIRRRSPEAVVQYFLVWESTKSGWPHAHLLMRAPYIPQHWLSNAWRELTGAAIVDIRQAGDSRSVGSYLAKYLAKQPVVPPGFRRFRTSLMWWPTGRSPLRPPRDTLNSWNVSRNPVLFLANIYRSFGWRLIESHDGAFTALPPSLSQGRLFSEQPQPQQTRMALDSPAASRT